MLSIDFDLSATLRIFRSSVVETGQFLRARRKQFETREVAVEDWQIFHILLAELDAHVGAIRLELGNVARNFDGLVHCSDNKLRVDGGGAVGIKNHARYFRYLEARGLNVYFIDVRNQVGNRVVPAFI